jgi:ubiquinone biosynthesis monooxygenase Coq7
MIPNRLPGDPNIKQLIDQIIRVNHAGEYGAKRIYEGQLAVLKNSPVAQEIEHMKQQELQHLAYFENEIIQRRVRPSVLHPLWHIGGFLLGVVTAKMGEKAAMACTVAVEEVIDEHYAEQIGQLQDIDAGLATKISQFRQEELEHKQTAIDKDAANAPLYPLLSSTIKTGCKLAIWLAKRF